PYDFLPVPPLPPRATHIPYTTLFRSVCDEGIGHRDNDPEQHGAQHPADRAFHRLFGADLGAQLVSAEGAARKIGAGVPAPGEAQDRKSTRLNSSHVSISYAVFCLKKK